MFNFFNKKQNNFTTVENTEEQYTLFEAIEKQDIDLIKKLIENGVDINQQNKDGNTPLIVAVMVNNNLNNQHEIIKYLLESSADVYIKNNYNFNILEIMEHKECYVEIRKIFEKYNYFKNTKNENDKYLISLENKENQHTQKLKEHNSQEFLENYYKAIAKGNIEELKQFIRNGADSNIKYNGCTLLYYTVYSNELEFTKFLLENGANPNIKNDSYVEKSKIYETFDFDGFEQSKNKTAIDLAIKGIGNEFIALEFYKYSKENDKLNKYLLERLLHAMMLSEYEKIKLFLSCNIDLDTMLDIKPFHSYETLLDFVLIRDFKILKIFLENNPTNLKLINGIKNKINNSYHFGNEDIEIFNQGIFSAIEKLDIQLIDAYIKVGINIDLTNNDSNKFTPLAYALSLNNASNKEKVYPIIELLLKNNTSVYNSSNVWNIMKNKKDYLEIKSIFEKYNYFKDSEKENELYLLINNKINPNQYKDGISLLYSSIVAKDIEEIEILLKNGADVNLKNKSQFESTPLHAAIEVNDTRIIDLLIKYEANENDLITLALANKKIDLAEYIIDKVKDFKKIRLGNYDSPLYIAISEENMNITQKLLVKGSNPNYVQSKSYYEYKKLIPLKLACGKQNFKIIKLLVENGADVNLTNEEGQTALFDAIEAKKANKDIIRYLIDYGANIYQEDDKGISPLSFAESNKKSLVKCLLENSNDESSNELEQKNRKINELEDKINELKHIRKENAENVKELIIKNDNIYKLKQELAKNKELIGELESQSFKGINLREIDDEMNQLKLELVNKKEEILQLKNENEKYKRTFEFEVETLKESLFKKNKEIEALNLKIEEINENIKSRINKKSKVNNEINPQKIKMKNMQNNDGVIVKRDFLDDF